jgi:hypothetical protein
MKQGCSCAACGVDAKQRTGSSTQLSDNNQLDDFDVREHQLSSALVSVFFPLQVFKGVLLTTLRAPENAPNDAAAATQ